MRILGDSNITAADVTATNVLAASFTEKLKNFQLTDKMITLTNETDIDFTFNGDIPGINQIVLCGTNLSPTAVVEVSYSDTDIESPDATISMQVFSTLNQVIFLDSVLTKKFWKVHVLDTGLSSLFVGYLYCGEYLDIPFVEFGHNAELNIFSNSSKSKTGQRYGGKTYNALPVDFTMLLNFDLLNDYIAIKLEKQNIDPVVLIEYIETYDNVLYRPKYGVLANTEIPYPQNRNTLNYAIDDRLEEIF
jgi:hypothetical protein